jgi:hypothetical protein
MSTLKLSEIEQLGVYAVKGRPCVVVFSGGIKTGMKPIGNEEGVQVAYLRGGFVPGFRSATYATVPLSELTHIGTLDERDRYVAEVTP